jgi:hypothetical protein
VRPEAMHSLSLSLSALSPDRERKFSFTSLSCSEER